MARQARIKNDRFGNPYQNVKCRMNKNGYPVGYIELGGKLYKVEPSQQTSTDNKSGEEIAWCRMTQVKKQQRATSM